MAQFRVTHRTCPKIKGEVFKPGALVELDLSNINNRLIADRLVDCGTLVKVAENPKTEPPAAPRRRGRPPKFKN